MLLAVPDASQCYFYHIYVIFLISLPLAWGEMIDIKQVI